MYVIYILKFVLLGLLFMDAISLFEAQQARKVSSQERAAIVAPVQASTALLQHDVRK